MSDATIGSMIGGLSALVAAVLAYIGGRARGRADAAKTGAEAATLASTDNRAWAEMFRGELDKERAERRRVEVALLNEQVRSADLARQVAELTARVAGLENAIRRAGLVLPGDTPPKGVVQ